MCLAERRRIEGVPLNDGRTPLLVPSFSSMAEVGWPVQDAIEAMREQIHETALVSLFDIGTGRLAAPTFPKLLFVDSGGYEMHRLFRANEDYGGRVDEMERWTREAYEASLRTLDWEVPTVVVTFDKPNDARPIDRQIDDALPAPPNGMIRELLLKAPPGTASRPGRPEIAFEDLEPHIDDIARFPIVGVTDKEIGRTLDRRLLFIGRLRRALERRGHHTPIHIFGSLDPVTAPLYFLAGADVFDGLAWQRFAFSDGGASYLQSHIAANGLYTSSFEAAQVQIWMRNLTELGRLQERMRAFLGERDFGVFGPHAELLRIKCGWLLEEVGG